MSLHRLNYRSISKQARQHTGIVALAAFATVASLASHARAVVTIDGLLDTAYGSPIITQTVNTGFGDNTNADGTSSGGSELDAAYGLVDSGKLNLFFSGNLQNNYNHLNIFIADGRAGQSTLSAGGSLSGMSGSKFSPGFSATYALDINGGGGPFTEYVNSNDLVASGGPSSYLGSFTPNDGNAHPLGSGVSISLNNTNVAGVNGNPAGAVSTANANAVSTGFEISIPLSLLGSPSGSVKVLADINGGGNGYLSNQFLPGLPANSSNLGGTTFDFSTVANQYFTVPIPSTGNILGTWSASGSGNWGTGSNWTGGNIPTSAADSATFASAIAAATVTLEANHTVGHLIFNNANSYTLAATGAFALTIDDTGDSSGVNPFISVMAGNHLISAPLILNSGVKLEIIDNTTLTIGGNISGAGDIIKTGGGTAILAGSNSHGGNIVINAGSVQLNTAASAAASTLLIGDPLADHVPTTLALGASGMNLLNAITTNHDGAGDNNRRIIAANYVAGAATVSGPILIAGGITFAVPSATATLNVTNAIADNTADTALVAKHDVNVNAAGQTGTVVLSAASTYTGLTNVNAGTLVISSSGSITSPTINVAAGANLNVNNIGGGLSSAATLNVAGTAMVASPAANTAMNLAGVSVTAGTLQLQGNGSTVRTVLATNSLSVTGSGVLDIGGNDAVIHNTSSANAVTTLTSVVSAIQSGAITSSLTNNGRMGIGAIINTDGATPTPAVVRSSMDTVATGLAQTDVLVKYTYLGDANLDGVVNGSDYTRIDAGYNDNTKTGWFNGDFNYDGKVDGSDYSLIDGSFGAALTALPANAIASPAASIAGPVAVPEPTTLGLIALGATALLGRQTRRSK